MKKNVIYILIVLITIILSGCVEQTENQFIKHPYIPEVSTGDKPVTDNEKIVGKWEFSKEYDSQKAYIRYIFNSDKTGTFETALEGKHYFKYEIGSFPIITGLDETFRTEEECKVRFKGMSGICKIHTKFIKLYDWKPSTSSVSVLPEMLDYEFIDNNNLMIADTVILERKFI